MKIKSPFKDYYDYCVGKYGIDPKVTYARVCAILGIGLLWKNKGAYKINPMRFEDYSFYVFHICGIQYCVYRYKDVFYHGEECESLPNEVNTNLSSHKTLSGVGNLWKKDPTIHLRPSDLNELYECPIIMQDGYKTSYRYKDPDIWKDVRLSDFGFARIIPAEKIWLDINNFLLQEKPIVNKQTDKEKIISHGFDLKHSFRNTK